MGALSRGHLTRAPDAVTPDLGPDRSPSLRVQISDGVAGGQSPLQAVLVCPEGLAGGLISDRCPILPSSALLYGKAPSLQAGVPGVLIDWLAAGLSPWERTLIGDRRARAGRGSGHLSLCPQERLGAAVALLSTGEASWAPCVQLRGGGAFLPLSFLGCLTVSLDF